MARVSNRDDSFSDSPLPVRLAALMHPLSVGYWGGSRIRIGYSLPVAVAVLLAAGWFWQTRPGNADLPVLAGILGVSLVGGAMYQVILRLWIGRLAGGQGAGGQCEEITMRAFGSWGRCRGSSAQRFTLGVSVPLLCLALAAALAAMPPHGQGWRGLSLLPPELTGQLTGVSVLVACAWILTLQAAVQTLPLPGCHGREAIVAVVDWWCEGQGRRGRAQAVRWTLGGIAVGWMMAALIGLALHAPAFDPWWPLMFLVGVACWLSRRSEAEAVPLAAAPPDGYSPSDLPAAADRPAAADFPGKPPFARPVSPLQSWQAWRRRRRLRAVRQRELREAADEGQLDAILTRLHEHGLDSLSAADKAVLKRVSDRLRDRPETQSTKTH